MHYGDGLYKEARPEKKSETDFPTFTAKQRLSQNKKRLVTEKAAKKFLEGHPEEKKKLGQSKSVTVGKSVSDGDLSPY